jgi:23S rRNA (adenine2503-C2)-methyltransferase
MLTQAVAEKTNQFIPLDAKGGIQVTSKALFGLNRPGLTALAAGAGEPAWRGRQLAEAMYGQRVTSLEEVKTLPQRWRELMAKDGWEIGRPEIVQVFRSVDGTERYLVQGQVRGEAGFADTVETVWMPEGDEGEQGDGSEAGDDVSGNAADEAKAGVEGRTNRARNWQRATICVSSQVGCAVNCQFCLTAKLGLQRNLTAGEIAGQVVSVMARQGVEVGKDRVNLVFMGMGEPLLNYDNFMGAVHLLVEEVGLSPQRMTVSTSGIVPGIERLALESPEVRPKLAISLNAPNDAIRSEVMPVNRKWPIDAVVNAIRPVNLRPRERITFEYVLLGGVTDLPEHARQVARLVRRTGVPAKVNLIAWNPGPGIAYEMPRPEAVETFRRTLAREDVPVYVRKPRGRDIYAACGQLKRTVVAGTESRE